MKPHYKNVVDAVKNGYVKVYQDCEENCGAGRWYIEDKLIRNDNFY